MTRDDLFKLHEATTKECLDIMRKKNNDYAGAQADADPFANFRRSEILGVPGEMGLLIRVIDKICRLKTYIESGKLAVANEGFEDAAKDIINYMVLLLGMLKDKAAKPQPGECRDVDPKGGIMDALDRADRVIREEEDRRRVEKLKEQFNRPYRADFGPHDALLKKSDS